ncbi:DUF4142 domain-containing protein [Massilia sp. H-1]|nr:DUF4142 domain-containing protein [Massilia sp. H-1]
MADHKKAHDKLSQAHERAKDPDVKALAGRILPIVDQHLNSAQQLHKNTAVGSSRTQGTTQSSDKPKSADQTMEEKRRTNTRQARKSPTSSRRGALARQADGRATMTVPCSPSSPRPSRFSHWCCAAISPCLSTCCRRPRLRA